MSETLHVVACVSNPLRWQSRIALARAAVADWLAEPNVHVTLAANHVLGILPLAALAVALGLVAAVFVAGTRRAR